MVKRIVIIVLFVASASVMSTAAEDGGYRSPFAVGMGARQLGMGGASVALINTSSAIYWNPAGLALVKQAEIQLFHMQLFMETRYDFVAVAYPTLSAGVFGAGIGDLSSGQLTRYNNYSSDGSTFSSRQDLFLVGYGFSPVRRLQAGAAVKGAYYDLDSYRDTGFGFDLGLIYAPPFVNGLSVGLKAADIYGPRIKLNSVEQRYPLVLRGGLGYEKEVARGYPLLLGVDVENTEKNGTDLYAGAELGFKGLFFSRLGFLRDRLALGAGVAYRNFSFDYAYSSLSELETSHRLSLSFAFGTPVDIKRTKREEEIAAGRLAEYRAEESARIQSRIDQELAEARSFEAQNEIYEATEAYYRVLGLDDQNEEARAKTVTMLELIRQDVARQANKGFVDDLVSSQVKLGHSYLEKGQVEKASEQFRLALILDPGYQPAKDGMVQVEARQENEIRQLKTEARQLNQEGKYEEALTKLDQVVRLKPDDAAAKAQRDEIYRRITASRYLDRALKAFDSADYERAGALVDSSLALDPQSVGAQSLKHQLERLTAEVTTLEDIKKNAGHWQRYLEAMDKYQAGQYEEAISIWNQLLEFYPNNLNLKRNIEQATERLQR